MISYNRPRHQDQLHDLADEALCHWVREGIEEAFLELFDRYWTTVFTLAHSVLRDRAEAEDLAQTLFVEVHTNLLQFDETRGSFRTLLLRSAYTRAIDHRRHLEARHFYSNVGIESLDADTFVQESLLIYGLTVGEAGRLIAQTMIHLDDNQRATVHAYFFRGLSVNEIAHELHESFGNVRHHLYRGLEKMRNAIIAGERPAGTEEVQPSAAPKIHPRFSKRLSAEVSSVRSQSI
jgi:RNA polymerase sigma-70 factor (ECF subfamily)